MSKDFAFHPTNAEISALAAMDAGNFWISKNNYYTWLKGGTSLPTWGGGNAIAFAGENTVYVALGQHDFKGIAKSTNLGGTFTLLHGSALGLPNAGSSGKAESVFAFQQDPDKVWAVIGKKLYYSENAGNNWSTVFSAADVFHIDGVNYFESEILIATGKGVYRGIDNDFTLYAPSSFKATFCKVDPFDSTVVFACGFREDNGGLWRYKNNQWKKLVDDKYVASIDINPQNSDEIVASTDDHPYHDKTFAKGVYLSRDGGDNWTLENTGLPVLRGGIIKFNPHNPKEIILGTGGRGYFKGTWEPEFVVNAFYINKNENEIRIYPNPFINTVFVIADRDSEFKLFSISGNQLKTGLLNKGKNHINLEELNSGVFIVQVADQKKIIIKQ
ncbi:MAG: T9SS type A sorting domain-containing protein [Bacteroidota bacterium]